MKPQATDQKLRGGYYTPEPVAKFLVEWAIQSPAARVLEPSCGDGVFLTPIVERLKKMGASPSSIVSQITAVELNKAEAQKAQKGLSSSFGGLGGPKVVIGDFFGLSQSSLMWQSYDAVVGNPPFIRYQHFPEEQRETAFRFMKSLGLHPTRLTNAWLPFVVIGSEILSQRGRMAMIVPAELLQVNYAAELRQYLSARFHRLTVFTFRHLLFEGIQQEVVLLCGERDGESYTGIRTIELKDLDDLKEYEHTPFAQNDLKPMDHSKEKWTQYFLTHSQIELLRKMRNCNGLVRLGELAEVNVGVVTGLNDFFVLKRSDLENVGADEYAMPLVARSGHLQGTLFTKTDWENNARNDLSSFLLEIPDSDKNELPQSLKSYIARAETRSWHKGYKCRIRSPWYSVPSTWVPDAFMLRQIYDLPRIIVNNTRATCTDTIHRVRTRRGVDVKRLAASAFNSLTFAFAEVIGRSYGGGVLELEPREALMLPLPYDAARNLDLTRIDQALRNGNQQEVLDYCDKILLLQGLGLDQIEVTELRAIWDRLRDRRIGRKT